MKKLFIFMALILITTAVVFAQNQVTSGSIAMPGSPNWASPQFTATQGMFRDAADNFIRPDYYSAVTFDKFFAMTSFASTNRVQLGYAGKIGNLYIGAAYGGSFWAGYTQLNYTEQEYGAWPGGSKKVPVYGFAPDNPFNGSGDTENRIAVLLGTADMGFRFTFSSVNHELISIKDSVLGGAVGPVKSYEAERGSITPQIAWAMAKDLTENGIRPYVLLDLGFVRRYIKGEAAGGGVYVANSENHFDPKLTLGLGGYTLYKSDGGFALLADLEYVLALRFYENEYTYMDGGDSKISTIKGLNSAAGLTENTYNGHRITTALVGRWSGGPLGLRFRLNLPVTLIGEESTDMTVNGSDLDSGEKRTTSSIDFAPYLQLAAQWKIVPKLTLNAGGRITLTAVGQTTIDTDYKTTPATSTKEIKEVYGNTTNNLTIGFTFLPTDNLTFEASTGIGANNSINVFDAANGLLSFTSLLVELRF
ncbi:MAG: hypothetical protein LBC52_00765 [Treponema sp.]|nr:hypothetical protein [Treponema sp.]